MTELVFVDTNVLVYAQDSRDLRKQQRATEWLERLWRMQSGRTSVQVLNEYYVTVTRKLQPGLPEALAWNHVEALGAWQPQGMDHALMRRARSLAGQAQLSWWDALIIAAAQLQRCSVLLSEDLSHRAHFGSVRVHNPFIDEIQERDPADFTQPSIELRHPARGRPRRERRVSGAN
jgi:predicted nucleic acid-binding protein